MFMTGGRLERFLQDIDEELLLECLQGAFLSVQLQASILACMAPFAEVGY